jgi:hypothetical protein
MQRWHNILLRHIGQIGRNAPIGLNTPITDQFAVRSSKSA